MSAPTPQPDYPSESRSQPDRQRRNGRFKTPVADHPQWRDYLGKRRILEPVIAAGTWVERETYTGQDILVWREKRRDGSLGATPSAGANLRQRQGAQGQMANPR